MCEDGGGGDVLEEATWYLGAELTPFPLCRPASSFWISFSSRASTTRWAVGGWICVAGGERGAHTDVSWAPMHATLPSASIGLGVSMSR